MEIMFCIVILAFALVPIMTMFTGGQKQAVLTEYHFLGQMRANMIVEMLAARGYEAVAKEFEKNGSIETPLKPTDPAIPDDLRKRWEVFVDEITFEKVAESDGRDDGLALIGVKVTWKLQDGISTKKADAHGVVVERLLLNPKTSLVDEPTLEDNS